MSFKGFLNLSDKQKAEAAHIAAMAGYDFTSASHIWYADDSQTLVMRLHTGVDVAIEPTYAVQEGYA
jgi:hypothetical protein